MTGVTEYDAYLVGWLEEKEAAEMQPLTAGLTLTANSFAALSRPYGPSLQSQRTDQRLPLDVTFRPALKLPSNVLSSVTFKLLYPLRAGPDHWSQVWVVSFRPHGSTDESHLVLKLFQEALFPFPDWSDFSEYQSWCASTQCAQEAWAITELKSLQGWLVPHSYGFYDFVLPCGQTVCGHVMELIDGEPLQRDYKGMLDGSFYSEESRSRKLILLERLALSVHTLHSHGVHHGDLMPGNVIRLRKDPTFFVFIDFAKASPTNSVQPDSLLDLAGLFGCFLELEECAVILKWIKRNIALKAPWAEPFDVQHTLEQWEWSCEGYEQRHLDTARWLRESGKV